MYNFNVKRNSRSDFKKQIERAIKKNTSLSLRIDAELNEDCFRNVFTSGEYEVNIERTVETLYKEYNVRIYKINVSGVSSPIFGCELETCITSKCISKFDEKIKRVGNLEFKLEKGRELVKYFLDWKNAMISYLETISKNFTEEFKNKFPVIYIVYNGKENYGDYVYDTNTGNYDEIYRKKIDIKDYKSIIITRDESVICGDTAKNYPSKTIPTKNFYKDSFHCEIITPILYDVEDLTLIYHTFFGQDCLRSNVTAGLHVNVSLLDGGKHPIYISKGFLDCLLDIFEKYEEENYDKLRPGGSWYAKRVLDYGKFFTYKYMRPVLDFKSDEEEANFYDNFVKGKKYYRSFFDTEIGASKYNTINIKSDQVVEFRLFPSVDEYTIAIEYTKDAISLLHQAAVEYSKNHKKIVIELQKKNLEVKINHSPIVQFEGYLYLYDEDKKEMLDLTDVTKLGEYIDVLFRNHNQDLQGVIEKEPMLYEATVKNLGDKKKMKYSVQVYDDFRVKITNF